MSRKPLLRRALSQDPAPVLSGARPREVILFIHGSLGGAADAFANQEPLRADFDLEAVWRRGYALDADPVIVNLGLDAEDILRSLDRGAHLVGASTGALVAMLAACRRPDLVRSLTLIEPPAFAVAMDCAPVREAVDRLRWHWTENQDAPPREFIRGFFQIMAMTRPVPDVVAPELARAVTLCKTERLWEFRVPAAQLRTAGVPILIVSGGWSAVYDAVCDKLALALGGAQVQIKGFGHAPQKAGSPFNDILRRHVVASAEEIQDGA
jgi:pimeloyl-ACP methyl ester carboxylesterase